MPLTVIVPFLLLQAAQTAQKGKLLSVCEVLSNLQTYNGKFVSVRGAESGAEGLFLSGENCPTRLETKGFIWPSIIWVTAPWSSLHREALHFDADQRSIKSTEQTLDDAGFRKGDTVIVTITGVLETYDHLEDHVFSKTHALGFGPDNIAPAQLIMNRMSDPKIRR